MVVLKWDQPSGKILKSFQSLRNPKKTGQYIDLISRGRENTGDYFPSQHYDRGQYGEGNNQAGIFEAEVNKSLLPARLS